MVEVSMIVRARSRVAPHLVAASLLSLALLACGGDGSPTATKSSKAATIAVVSGSGQSGSAGSELPSPLVVRVAGAAGGAVGGATVRFRVTSGSATLAPSSTTTDANGEASTTVTLGATAGAVTVTATVAGTSLAAAFGETILDQAAACDPSGATSLSVGQAIAVTASSLCVAAGASAGEFALVAFNPSADAATAVTVGVMGTGVDVISSVAASAAVAGSTPSFSMLAAGGRGAPVTRRRIEPPRTVALSRAMAPRIAAARRWYRTRRGAGARLDLAGSALAPTPAVGQIISLNSNGDDACANARPTAARVMANGSKAIVVADTANPAGGYTTADYQSIAAEFDTLVDPVDTRNFGQPTDIDGNAHVVLFFTRAVNALTPKDADYYIAGFFFSRDLLPVTDTDPDVACAGSNQGEMFYLMVPDPGGVVNGNKFSKAFVTRVDISTVAHEYQHLINSSRRLYLNAATDFEEVWLDEGLSHIAEELLFYAESRLAPGEDLDAPTLRASTTALDAFNDDAIGNFGRLESYLGDPSASSPYANDDSLSTRGATWSFLRWAADHQPTDQTIVWFALVNSSATGLANLQRVFGTDLPSLFRAWSVSLDLDDVAGSGAVYQMPSWNLRSIYGALENGSYPLSKLPLTSGIPATARLVGGGSAYFDFALGAGRTGALSLGAVPSGVSLTLLRVR